MKNDLFGWSLKNNSKEVGKCHRWGKSEEIDCASRAACGGGDSPPETLVKDVCWSRTGKQEGCRTMIIFGGESPLWHPTSCTRCKQRASPPRSPQDGGEGDRNSTGVETGASTKEKHWKKLQRVSSALSQAINLGQNSKGQENFWVYETPFKNGKYVSLVMNRLPGSE